MPIEDEEKIRFRSVPLAKWTFGTLLLLIFLLIFLAVFLFGALSWVAILIVGVPSLLILGNNAVLLAPITIVDIYPGSRYVQVTNARLYGRQGDRYYFSQIDKFKSYKGKLNFSQQYLLALVLANRRTVKLRVPISKDKQETVKLIKKLNKIVRKES